LGSQERDFTTFAVPDYNEVGVRPAAGFLAHVANNKSQEGRTFLSQGGISKPPEISHEEKQVQLCLAGTSPNENAIIDVRVDGCGLACATSSVRTFPLRYVSTRRGRRKGTRTRSVHPAGTQARDMEAEN